MWIEDTDFVAAFCAFEISAYMDSFTNNFVEIVSDDGSAKAFEFTLQKESPVWIGASYYSSRMYPTGCSSSS